MTTGRRVEDVIKGFRDSDDPELMSVADLIEKLIDDRQDAINKRERDLAVWRNSTELLRELVGREHEDVGPRRIVLDLLRSEEKRFEAINSQLIAVARFYGDPANWQSSPYDGHQAERWLYGGNANQGWEYANSVLEELGLKDDRHLRTDD